MKGYSSAVERLSETQKVAPFGCQEVGKSGCNSRCAPAVRIHLSLPN